MGDPVDSGGGAGPPGVEVQINPNKDVTLNNPVLCVIIGWFEKYAKADVYSRVSAVFEFTEVKEAKRILCNNEHVKEAVPGKVRKGPSVRSIRKSRPFR